MSNMPSYPGKPEVREKELKKLREELRESPNKRGMSKFNEDHGPKSIVGHPREKGYLMPTEKEVKIAHKMAHSAVESVEKLPWPKKDEFESRDKIRKEAYKNKRRALDDLGHVVESSMSHAVKHLKKQHGDE